jgi:TDG/mug DNA glycosylase family protein
MPQTQQPWRPTRAQLLAAHGKGVPDIIARDLRVLFCGINPGLYSAAVGHHFARPGNRFWPTLAAAGFTPSVVSPFEESQLRAMGLGVTNIVSRATAGADELSRDELIAGARRLARKVRRYQPKALAILGVSAYRTAFGLPKATIGLQPVGISRTSIWVLPNPSGLNAHYQLAALAAEFGKLRRWMKRA